MLEPKKRGAHSKSVAAKKENPQKGFTQNPRGPRTEHLHTPVWAHRILGVTVCGNCKQPKGSLQIDSEPALKEIREGAQNNSRQLISIQSLRQPEANRYLLNLQTWRKQRGLQSIPRDKEKRKERV